MPWPKARHEEDKKNTIIRLSRNSDETSPEIEAWSILVYADSGEVVVTASPKPEAKTRQIA